MEKPPVVVRLMEQIKRMADLAQSLEAAGKLMSKAEKVRCMNIEKNKLDALKQEQLEEQAAPQAGAVAGGEAGWGAALAATSSRKTRSDYIDFPCSQLGSDPNILEHCVYTNFTTGREAVRQCILQNKLFGDVNQTKESMTTRMGGRVGGAGAPSNGKLDWEFEDGRGLR